jgi:hypothetical protein
MVVDRMTQEPQDLPGEVLHLLFLQWVYNFSRLDLGVSRYDSFNNEWVFSNEQAGTAFRLRVAEDVGGYIITATDFDERQVAGILRRAYDAAIRREAGDVTYYCSEFLSPVPVVDNNFGVQFLRILGDGTSISGWRRLGDQILLEFEPDPASDRQQLFAPSTRIRVHLFAPGGGPGPLSGKIASNLLEFARVVCTFALGRSVDGSPAPPSLVRSEHGHAAENLRFDQNVLTLARSSVPLDPFTLMSLGDIQSVNRYHSALIAFDAALRQSNADVAAILFVSGIEAIVSPDPTWRKQRLVARFVKAVLDYAPDTVDGLLNHANIEQAFAFRLTGGQDKQRRKLLERIYEIRSMPVHSGLSMAFGLLDSENISRQLRVALLSDLYQGVLLAFLQSPRSSLVGHPDICPGSANE